MDAISSSEARNNFAAVLDKAQYEPVVIHKQGRNVAILLSCKEYERLTNASVMAFQAISDDIGTRAASRGLTAEKIARLLAV